MPNNSIFHIHITDIPAALKDDQDQESSEEEIDYNAPSCSTSAVSDEESMFIEPDDDAYGVPQIGLSPEEQEEGLNEEDTQQSGSGTLFGIRISHQPMEEHPIDIYFFCDVHIISNFTSPYFVSFR